MDKRAIADTMRQTPCRVFRSGQKRGVFVRHQARTPAASAIEAVIGHMKSEDHLGRNLFEKGRPTGITPMPC